MDLALGDAKGVPTLAYIDDVVFPQTFDEHLEHLQVTLKRMRPTGLTGNSGKVQLASSQVKPLG